ncbi:MAG TPA: acyl-CoA dehydrogenase family protein [Pseudolabrys sp.]|jgi:(2S)-methylsuccinyl-CoA dehydrogenase|nr:acyl-CoA dehydrogenase family protein [Pseudolabrys sp.]
MPIAASRPVAKNDVVDLALEASAALDALLVDATAMVRERVVVEGRVVGRLFDREQRATHGLAWLATYVGAVRQLAAYATRMADDGTLGETEELLVRIGLGEYLAQVAGGIPMSQGEVVRPSDLGLSPAQTAVRINAIVEKLVTAGNSAEHRARLIELIRAGHSATVGTCGLGETLDSIREEMRRFADSEVIGNAQTWHLTNSYVPLEVIAQMSELGVFGLTIPEDFGGMALGKESMCVVSEELSRGYIGVGSLGTRSEIAAELILGSGTGAQKEKWLPKIASGEVLPTAVFTEPNTGSDLASIKTRAVREGNVYRVYGSKTWITHPVRADLMTLLVRTNPKEAGHRGLSMLLAEKPRGDDRNPFPAEGMSGTEIEVLGYRGMKEYEIAFDGFAVKAENLLGGVEGLGFKQLMQTFESARIQTAARAIGVAQAAMEQALDYAQNRTQFGGPIIGFPRVADKIVMMAAEIMIARQLTYYAAREKDSGRRCDLEAGMAKLLAARVAWAAADNAVQVHGGNGFALEFPVSRILCDARILNIFEGAAEIQAQVIARRLLDGTN